MLDCDRTYYRIVYQDDGSLIPVEMTRQDEWDCDKPRYLSLRTYKHEEEARDVIEQLDLLLSPAVTPARISLLRQIAGAL